MIRVRAVTLGCKANHADTEAICAAFGPDVRLVGESEAAAVVVVNSCTVTHTRLHVPRQSGDDGTLARMRRVYRVAHYACVLDRFRRRVPRGAWGIDVMVGFPREDDASFRRTLHVLGGLDFTYLNVLPFSRSAAAEAATTADPVPEHVKRERCRILGALGDARRSAHASRAIGEVATVLAEGKRVRVDLLGYSENYVAVTFAGAAEWTRTLQKVKITGADGGIARGSVIGDG